MNPEQQKQFIISQRAKGIPDEQILQSINQQSAGDRGIKGFSTGVAKGEVSTVMGLGNIGESILNQTAGRVVNAVQGKGFQPTTQNIYGKGGELTQKLNLQPQGTAEKTGFAVEKIAEFLLPSSAVVKGQQLATGAIKGTGLASNLAKIGARAGVEGVSTGAITTAQQGEFNDVAKNSILAGLLFSGATQGLTASLKGGAKLVGGLGKKIQQTRIRPSARDLEEVFVQKGQDPNKVFIDNVFKYDLGGNPEQIFAKSTAKINSLVQQVDEKIATAGDRVINVTELAERVKKKIASGITSQFGENKALARAYKDLLGEIDVLSPDGNVGLVQAQLIKRGAGTKGAWSFGIADPDAKAKEKVYTLFYKEMKEAIEQNAPEGIKELNRQISDIIPILHAVIRRMPIEARNNALSLTDSIGLFAAAFDPKALALIGATKLAKSGRFARFLVNASNKAMDLQPKSSLGQRITGGI